MKKTSNQKSELFIFCVLSLILSSQLSALGLEELNDYDSIIVQPKERILRSRRIDYLMYRRGVSKFQKINDSVYLIPLDEGTDKQAKIDELKQSRLFDLVEPDYKFSLDEVISERHYVKITNHSEEKNLSGIGNTQLTDTREITPNDKGFADQYYLREINATKAWSTTVGDSLLVGVLDTGVDVNHPDLTGKILGGLDLDRKNLIDEIGHGTEVSGIIAANTNNHEGIAGIAWNTKILSLKVTDDFGQARVSTVVSALDEAYKNGVRVAQISLSTNQFSQTLKNAIKEAQDRGILIISTAGNSGIQELRYPAAFDGVIGVGAVNDKKEIESYSTTGEHVSLVAPGSRIYTTSLDSSYDEVSGTSFSAPQVAGAAALVLSVAPNLTNNEVREILISSADDLGEAGKDKEYGHGILNIQKAVELAKAKIESNNLEIKSWIKR